MEKKTKNKKIKSKTKARGAAGVKKSIRADKAAKNTAVSEIISKNEAIVEKDKRESEAAMKKEERNLIVLETFDHVTSEEEKMFYYMGIAISALMTIVFGWQRNFTAALVFVMMIAVLLMFLAKKPVRIVLRLDKDYFWINDEKYNVFNLEYFWFSEKYGIKYFNIKIKKNIIPVFSVALSEINTNAIRKAFLNFIPEISPEDIENGALDKYNEPDEKNN